MSLTTWLAFFATCIVLAVSPGPGAMASMNAGLAHGLRGGLRLVAGLQTALLLQLTAVALGAGALLAASDTAFRIAKSLGAAYLIWLGIGRWRDRGGKGADSGNAGAPAGTPRLYRRGILVNLSNPKAIVFIAALVPQFVDGTAPQLPQYLAIAATMCGVDSLVMGSYAGLASRCRPWLLAPARQRWQNRLFGGIFITLGAALLLSERPRA